MKQIIKVLFLVVLSSLLVIGIFLTTTVMSWVKTAPVLTKAALTSDSSSTMTDVNNKIIWQSSSMKREYTAYNQLDSNFIDALTSTENKTFFKDDGVDWRSVAIASLERVSGRSQRGASTLTQQLVKLSVFSTKAKDVTFKRKIQEMFLAASLTKTYSKNQLLEFYINKVYMGHNIYGIGTAAKYYYGKPLKELSTPQVATLAGILNSPAYFDLYGNEAAIKRTANRRDVVLTMMLRNHKLTPKQFAVAMNTKITNGLVPKEKHTQTYLADNAELLKNQWFVDSTLKQVEKLGYNPNKDGLVIKTEFNQTSQNTLLDTINNSGALNDNINGVQAAGTIVDVHTGAVIAQVGGRHTGDSLFGFNRATSSARSSGSGIKPLIDYGPAIQDLGWGSNHLVLDAPYTYPGTNVQLGNATPGFSGDMTMANALAQSKNTTAVRTLDAVGGQRASSFLDKLDLPNNGAKTGGSDAIGLNVSTAQLASAYAAVSNGGVYQETRYVTSVVTPDGVETKVPTNSVQAMSPATAYILISMMKGVLANGATGEAAQIKGLNQAVKTGTVGYGDEENAPASAIKDLWVNGITKGVSLSLWVGYDEPLKNFIPIQDYNLAHYVYKDVMKNVANQFDKTDWNRPQTVINTLQGLTPISTKNINSSIQTTNPYPDGTNLLNEMAETNKIANAKSGVDAKTKFNARTVSAKPWSFPEKNQLKQDSSQTSDNQGSGKTEPNTEISKVGGNQ